jgi:hypothetical protein
VDFEQAESLAGLRLSLVCFSKHTGKHGKKIAILIGMASAVADFLRAFCSPHLPRFTQTSSDHRASAGRLVELPLQAIRSRC